jgi:K+-sensing histidine kinase KdpD
VERDSPLAYGIAGLVPVAVGAALVAVRGEVVTANLALIMVLTVVLAGAFGGRGPGAFAAIAAAMSFDFFLTQPYQSLTIDRADDIETTIVLLVIGLVVGQVAVRANIARRVARRGADDIQRVHRIAELGASGAPCDTIVEEVQRELTDLLHLRGCRFDRSPSNGWLPVLQRSGTVTGVQIHYFAGHDFALPEQGVELPVRHGGVELGHLVLQPDPTHGVPLEERLVAVTLADQLGATLAHAAPARTDH